jgi:hypothetical protein
MSWAMSGKISASAPYTAVIPRAEAMTAYPLLVKPFLAGGAGQNKFVWLHRADSRERQGADVGSPNTADVS